jgi:hypothetical protein
LRESSRIAATIVLAALWLAAPRPILAEDESPEPRDTPADRHAAPSTAFAIRSMHLLHLPLLDFGAAQPGAPAVGAFEWSLSSIFATTYSTTWHARRVHDDPAYRGKPFSQEEAAYIHNAFPQDEVLFVDGEALRTALSARYGLTRSFSVSLEIPYITRGTTGLERFVVDFHKALGIKENGRDEFPKGRAAVLLQYPGGPISLKEFVPDSGLGDVTATFSWRRPQLAGGWTFGADLSLKAPTGRSADFNGSGGWDGGLLAFLVWEKARWTLELDGSLVVPGRWKVPVPLDPAAAGRVLLSAIYGFSARTRAGLSITAAQSPFRDHAYSSLSKAGVEVGLGVEHDFGRRVSARLMLTEQAPSAGDRSDFGVFLGLCFR